MSITHTTGRVRFVSGLLALLGWLVFAAPVDAQRLFFSEYVEGSSNNKALEIYNPSAIPVDLAAAGYIVEMYFNGNPARGLAVNLVGTVAPGGVFVLAHALAETPLSPQDVQRQTQGRVVPDSFTHGSSEQRVRWFKTGFETGKVSSCDTFQTAKL